jgi:hypothetical protein
MSLTSTSSDADVLAQYENSARYWESYANAADHCEAISFIINRFNRMNTIGGKSWTREDLQNEYEMATAKREAMQPSTGPGAKVHFTRGRCRSW